MEQSGFAADTELEAEDSVAVSIFISSGEKTSLFTDGQPDP